jgi:putative endonuclease
MQLTKQLGFSGEQAVAEYLKKQNFTIIEQNYTSYFGEIDLIAKQGELIVFVEVKTRKINYFPTSTVVTYPKQKKIIKTAKHFIMQKQIVDKVLRFDVATVTVDKSKYDINYIENAFYGQ